MSKQSEALRIVLASYRDMFGVKTERANELHRDACIEVARLEKVERIANAATALISSLTADGWIQDAYGGTTCIGCGREEGQDHDKECAYEAFRKAQEEE